MTMKRIIFCACAILLLTSCESTHKKQKEWISDNLANFVWIDTTYDALEEQAYDLLKDLTDKANQAIAEYNDKGDEDDINSYLSAAMLGLSDLYYLSGGSSSAEKKRAQKVEYYIEHSSSLLEQLEESIMDCFSYRDSSLAVDRIPDNQYIFKALLGEPDNIPEIDDEDIEYLAKLIAVSVFQDMERPAVSSIQYDKDRGLWLVRMDDADNQYVKFYERTDGEYDVEYSSGLNDEGEPDTDEKYTTDFSGRKPTVEKLYGIWRSDNSKDGTAGFLIDKEGARTGYDIKTLEAKGDTGYKQWASTIKNGIAYSDEACSIDIDDDGKINFRDSDLGYLYHSFYLDPTGKIMVDAYDNVTVFIKQKSNGNK